MKHELAMVVGLALLAACGGSTEHEQPSERACTLPDCSQIRAVGPTDGRHTLVGFAAGGALVLRSWPHVEDELAHVDLETGAVTVLGERVHAGSVRIAGDRVLFVRDAMEKAGVDRGVLVRWSPDAGIRPIASDARAGWYGACGEWVWFWQGGGMILNCAPVVVTNLATGETRDLGESCDLADEVARFDQSCGVLITGEPIGRRGVGVHRLDSGETTYAGHEGATGNVTSFRLSADGAYLAVEPRGALNLVDIARDEARTLASGDGKVLAFSPDSRELLLTAAGTLHRLALEDEGAEPAAVAEVGAIAHVAYAPDGRRVAFIDQRNGRPTRLRVFERGTDVVTDLAEGAYGWWFPRDLADQPAARLQPLVFAGGGRWLLHFTWSYGDSLRLWVWDTAKRESRLLSANVRVQHTVGGAWPRVAVDEAHGLVAWSDDEGLKLASLRDESQWKVAEDAVLPHFSHGHLVWSDSQTIFALPIP